MSDETLPLTGLTSPEMLGTYREQEAEGSDVPLHTAAIGLQFQEGVIRNVVEQWAKTGADPVLVSMFNQIAGAFQIESRLALLIDRRLSEVLERTGYADAWQRRELARMEERFDKHLAAALDEVRADCEAAAQVYVEGAQKLSQEARALADQRPHTSRLLARVDLLERRVQHAEDRIRGWQFVAVLLLGLALGGFVAALLAI